MKKIKVNVVSDSEFTVQGHGVHTAFTEMVNSLKSIPEIDLSVNSKDKDFDIIHIHTFGWYGAKNLWFQKNGKKVVSVHVIPDSLVADKLKLSKAWMPAMRQYMKTFYNKADLNLAVSNKVAEVLERDFEIDKSKIHTMYNTINTSAFKTTAEDRAQARKKLKIPKSDLVVVGAGQLLPRKRIDSFISVAKKLPNINFFWVGGAPFKVVSSDFSKTKDLMKSAPPNVTFTGLVDRDLVTKYLQAADVFFLPAEQENHPVCVIEAAAVGLPIILRNLEEYNDTFRGDAILCKNNTEFSSAIKKLQSDPDFYKETQKGSKKIARRYDSKSGTKELVKLYQELL